MHEARFLVHKRAKAYGRLHRERGLAAQAHHSLRKIGCHYSGCQPNALTIGTILPQSLFGAFSKGVQVHPIDNSDRLLGHFDSFHQCSDEFTLLLPI